MATVAERGRSASSAYSSTQAESSNQPSTTVKTVEAKENELLHRNTNASESESQDTLVPDPDAFGNEDGAEIQYKTCKWWHTGVLMLAENVSLGVLALPQALAILGLVPGLLCIFFLGLIATYTGWIIGEFRIAHPSVQSFADCGRLIAGPTGYWILATGQVLILIFIMGAHVLSFSIAMNAITNHALCTIWWNVIGLCLCLVLGLPRTFKNVSYLSIFSCLSIIVAVTIAMIAIGIQKPDMGNILAVRPNVPLIKGMGPVLNIILAYTGHVAFFSFQSELADPNDFKKALFLEQSLAITFYMTISVVIYYYAGPLVASPALGSASPLVTKIAFGVALPTIIVAGVVNGSVACKFVYVKLWAGTNIVHQRGKKSMGSWYGICGGAWVVSWFLAEVIPNFNLFLGLIGALFGSWFSFALPPMLWLYQHKGNWWSTKRKITLTVVNFVVVVLGITIFGLGIWSSGTELSEGTGGKVFSCANNWEAVSWVAEEGKSQF